MPILKEVIEILFQEGLIKALFSTETFSMGLNVSDTTQMDACACRMNATVLILSLSFLVLQMPCKTVVFTSVKKWDGDTFRVVTGGEYIQMSGRAGRRGLDDRGIVILMMDEGLEPNQAKEMMKGQADCLDSSFHLGYGMLLSLLLVEDQNPTKMMARSFLQFQSTRKAPKLQGQLEEVEKKREAIVLRDAKAVAEYHALLEQIASIETKLCTTLTAPQYILPFLNPGRLLRLGADGAGQKAWGWGVLLNFTKKLVSGRDAKLKGQGVTDSIYVLDVLLHCAPGSGAPSAADAKKKKAPKLAQNIKPAFTPSTDMHQPGAEYLIVPVVLTLVEAISSVRLNMPGDVRSKEDRNKLGATLQEVKKRFTTGGSSSSAAAGSAEPTMSDLPVEVRKDKKKAEKALAVLKEAAAKSAAASAGTVSALNIPLLDPVTDMKITDEAYLKLRAKQQALQARASAHKYASKEMGVEAQEQLALYAERTALDKEILSVKSALRDATQDVSMAAQLKRMQVVLRRLEHTTSSNVIDLKGRVACEISTCDELLGTELMFLGVFNDLAPEQCVALCSCLVFNEKNDDVPRLKEELSAPLRVLQEAARRIATVMNDAQLTIDVDDYVARFQPQLMEVVYAWCKGAKFSEVCKMTEVFEGTIIRCLRRLEELLRQFAQAAKSVGNDLLEQKFTAGITMLKRDVVFAASLYL